MKKLVNKYKNLNKGIKIILWIIALICFVFFFARFQRHKLFIKNYNLGNLAFKGTDYDEAEYRYEQSLYYKPTKRKECNVRINYALSIVTPITPESVTYDNLEESIDRLTEAKNILTESDCAHEFDTNGHNRKAQTLKEEIDEYIEWLKENVQPPEEQNEPEENQDDPENNQQKENPNQGENEDDSEAQQKENELRNLIEQGQKDGQEERFLDSEYYSNWDNFSFYDGQNW